MARIGKRHFGDPPENDFTPLPAGDYVAEITRAKGERTKNGKPFLDVELVVQDEEYQNRRVWDKIFLTPKAWRRYKAFCEAAGLVADHNEEYETNDLLRKLVVVTLEVTEWDNRERNEVTFDGYNPVEPDQLEDAPVPDIAPPDPDWDRRGKDPGDDLPF